MSMLKAVAVSLIASALVACGGGGTGGTNNKPPQNQEKSSPEPEVVAPLVEQVNTSALMSRDASFRLELNVTNTQNGSAIWGANKSVNRAYIVKSNNVVEINGVMTNVMAISLDVVLAEEVLVEVEYGGQIYRNRQLEYSSHVIPVFAVATLNDGNQDDYILAGGFQACQQGEIAGVNYLDEIVTSDQSLTPFFQCYDTHHYNDGEVANVVNHQVQLKQGYAHVGFETLYRDVVGDYSILTLPVGYVGFDMDEEGNILDAQYVYIDPVTGFQIHAES